MNIQKKKNNDPDTDLVLTNFNIPRKMKKRFKDFLSERNISQTSFLNSKIDEFIRESENQ